MKTAKRNLKQINKEIKEINEWIKTDKFLKQPDEFIKTFDKGVVHILLSARSNQSFFHRFIGIYKILKFIRVLF